MISIPKVESFTNDVNLYNKYKPSTLTIPRLVNAEREYLKSVYGDKITNLDGDLLIMSRCLKYKVNTKPDDFKKYLDTEMNKLTFPYQSLTFLSYSYTDIERKVLEKIKEFYTKNKLEILNGPIYVLVFQAPYLRLITEDCKTEPMSVQFNYHNNYNNIGYFVGGKNDCNSLPKDLYINKTHILMYLLYPTYNKKGKFIYKNWENIKCNMQSILKQFHYDPSCFIKCKDTDKPCGCLNSDKPYKSRCLGDNGINKMDKTLYNHGILYLINSEKASSLVNGSLFGTNVNIMPYDYNIKVDICKDITTNPSPLINFM
jgi:hypothetical protein